VARVVAGTDDDVSSFRSGGRRRDRNRVARVDRHLVGAGRAASAA
jgi:hypothetical protein